ncbi:8472_t:CDS:1, partial [Entrophospora sp. SA101]
QKRDKLQHEIDQYRNIKENEISLKEQLHKAVVQKTIIVNEYQVLTFSSSHSIFASLC